MAMAARRHVDRRRYCRSSGTPSAPAATDEKKAGGTPWSDLGDGGRDGNTRGDASSVVSELFKDGRTAAPRRGCSDRGRQRRFNGGERADTPARSRRAAPTRSSDGSERWSRPSAYSLRCLPPTSSCSRRCRHLAWSSGSCRSLHGHAGLATLTGHIPPEGKAVAILDIPEIHLDQVVVEGTSATDLTAGPGLMPGSALPGTPGNTVIAGRRYLYGKPFSALGSLKRGETLQIVSSYGTFTYRVLGTHVVEPGQLDPVAPTADNRRHS